MGFSDITDACQYVFASDGGSLPPVNAYSAIASSSAVGVTPPLKDFINAGYTIGKPNSNQTDQVLRYFAGKGPATLKAKPNIVKYFSYPLSGNIDFRTTPLSSSDYLNTIKMLIHDGNLISQTQLYNPADFQKAPTPGQASLIFLYQTMSLQNLSSSQTAEMDTLQAINLNTFGEILAEYCYYKKLYLFLLNKYFQIYTYSTYQASGPDIGIEAIGGKTATATVGPRSTLGTTKQTVQGLNLNQIAYYLACLSSRMMDINGLLAAINIYYSNAITDISKQLEASGKTFGSQSEVEGRLVALQASAKDINKLQSEADYRKGIIDYTQEKNRYSNILLGLYAFLNIAAIGIIMNLRE
jgi:hypothetical protein